jgi:NADH-quinone oxidoreductase subunit B
VNVVLGSLDQMINWGRSNSLWSLTFGTSCCGIEFMAVGCARYDFSRFGFEVTRNSARQADLIMCAGTITNKMAPVFKRLYDEMAEPKYVVAVGGCTISGGPFKKSYSVVRGIDQIVPVDVYIPGCPPRPEAILYGMMQLQRKVKVEKFFGGANHKMNSEEKGRAWVSAVFMVSATRTSRVLRSARKNRSSSQLLLTRKRSRHSAESSTARKRRGRSEQFKAAAMITINKESK